MAKKFLKTLKKEINSKVLKNKNKNKMLYRVIKSNKEFYKVINTENIFKKFKQIL